MMLAERLDLQDRKRRHPRIYRNHRRRYLPGAMVSAAQKLAALIEEAEQLGVPVPPEVCAAVMRCRELTEDDAVNEAWDRAMQPVPAEMDEAA